MWPFGDDKKAKAKKSAALREQAMANARAARERIGDETIQKIAASLKEQEKSPEQRAREKLAKMDQAVIADHIKLMIEDK